MLKKVKEAQRQQIGINSKMTGIWFWEKEKAQIESWIESLKSVLKGKDTKNRKGGVNDETDPIY